MRRYDDPVDVRTGDGHGSRAGEGPGSPEQFLWRGQLWQVRGVLAHWVETAEWWRTGRARAVAGTDAPTAVGRAAGASATAVAVGATTSARAARGGGAGGVITTPRPADVWDELLAEREVWRVEARRPVPGNGPGRAVSAGVFELAHDAASGRWQLRGCTD